jgi:hypothetical protein
VVHGVDACRRLGSDDAAIAVADDDGRLIARRQDLPDSGDVLGQSRSLPVRCGAGLAAARQRGRNARDVPLGQELGGPVPPPRSVLHTRPLHEHDSHRHLLDLFRSALGPLAAATDTSTRMLIYHFGTRDALLREILVQARQRQLDVSRGLLMDLDATGDKARAARAFADFLATLAVPAPGNA